MADIYVFIGPPGAGKGTIGEMFCEKTGAVHVSTGDILRQEMAAGTDLGNKVKGIIAAGGLVSDSPARFHRPKPSKASSSGPAIAWPPSSSLRLTTICSSPA